RRPLPKSRSDVSIEAAATDFPVPTVTPAHFHMINYVLERGFVEASTLLYSDAQRHARTVQPRWSFVSPAAAFTKEFCDGRQTDVPIFGCGKPVCGRALCDSVSA